MAHTARSDEDKKEYFDSPEELEKKVDQLATLVKRSKHFIAFTVRYFTIIQLLALIGINSTLASGNARLYS